MSGQGKASREALVREVQWSGKAEVWLMSARDEKFRSESIVSGIRKSYFHAHLTHTSYIQNPIPQLLNPIHLKSPTLTIPSLSPKPILSRYFHHSDRVPPLRPSQFPSPTCVIYACTRKELLGAGLMLYTLEPASAVGLPQYQGAVVRVGT